MADQDVALDTSPSGRPLINIYPAGASYKPGLAGWDAVGSVVAPEAATAPAGAPAPPAAQGGDALGGWGQLGQVVTEQQPPPGPTPDQTSVGGAAKAGAIDAATFGTAPAIAGLSAASGINTETPADSFSLPALGTAAVEAGKAIVSPVVGAYKMATGDQDAVAAYNKARQDALDEQNAEQANHPYAYLGGAGAATLAALPFTGGAGAARSAIGGIAKGVRAGAIGGAAFGGGKAIGEGDSLGDVLKGAGGGAVVGGLTGGALGGAAESVGAVGRKVASVIRGKRDPDAEARRIVQSVFQGEGQRKQVLDRLGDTEAIRAGREADTPISIGAYGGAPGGATARAAANVSPEAREVIGQFVQSGFHEQSTRFGNWLRSKFGAFDSDADKLAIKAAASRANRVNYKRAEAEAERKFPKGIWSPVLERLAGGKAVGRAFQAAAENADDRAILEGHGAFNPSVTFQNGILKISKRGGVPSFPDLRMWDYAQRELREMATQAKVAGRLDEAERLGGIRQQIVAELDKLVPSFQDARGVAAKFFGAVDAIDAGAKFVTDNNISNATAARAVAKMSPAERALFARGFAERLSDLIERRGDSANVLTNMFVKSRRARQRIDIALGADGAAQFEALKRVEGMIDRFRLAAVGNSTTTQQLADHGIMSGGVVAGAVEALHGAFNPAYLIAGAFIVGGRHVAREIDQQVALRVAQMLVSDDAANIAKGYQIVARNPVLMAALRYGTQLTARQLIAQLRPSGTAALGATIYHDLRGSVDEASGRPPAADDQYQNDNAGPGPN